MLPGTNHQSTKDYNRRIVLKAIAFGAQVSRADVARQTLLTPQTISNIVADLIDEGLVLEHWFAARGVGPRSIALDLNPEGAYAIGLSMDPFHVTAVLANVVGGVEARIRLPGSYGDPEVALDLFAKAVRQLLDERRDVRERLWGVGLGLPGPADPDDKAMTNIEDFPAWVGVPVAKGLAARLEMPVHVENNATAAAIGEAWFGKGREFRHFFYFFVTKGIGGGLIINGEPYHGMRGFSGEVGLIPATGHGTDPLTRMGDLISLDALQARLGDDVNVLGDRASLARLWEIRDARVLAWLDEASVALANLLVAVEYLLDPEAIVVSGHVPEPILDALLERASHALQDLRTHQKPHRPQLVKGMGGENYSALGVATLPIYDAIAPSSDRLRVRVARPTPSH